MGDIIKFPKAPVFDLTVFALPYTDDRIAAAQAIGQDAANKSFDQMRALFGGAPENIAAVIKGQNERANATLPPTAGVANVLDPAWLIGPKEA